MMFDKANDIKTQLEQMGDELHECRSCIQSILTRNLNGILITDLDWIVLFANPVAECFFNAQEQGLLGTPFNFSLTPGEAKELNVRSQDGESIAAEMWMVDIEWAGNPAIFISIHDISERKRNDYERRKMYQAMMQSPNSVMITDNNGIIEDVNPRFTELTGYEAGEVIGKNPRFLQSGLTPPERYRELWEALTLGREWRGEFINKKKDGEFYTESASIAPITNFDGTVTHFVAVKDDISDRKKAEETLAVSEIRYRRLFETTGDGILILEAESGRIIDVNPMLVEMLGYTGENFIGKKLWDFGVFADIEASKASFKELQHEEYIRYEDLPFETKDGRQIFVEFISKVYLSDGKKLIQCNIRDITERKQAQEKIAQLDVELAKRAAELEATNQELEAFNYTVAHKLRQPLNVISSYCQAVIEICNNKLDKQCQRYLQEIYKGTLSMSRQMDALLSFTDLARVGLRPETVDLSAVAHTVAKELKMSDPERRITFRITDGFSVEGDAGLLKTVLDNLLGNAWKYTGTREEAIIEFGVMETDGTQSYFVRDNGVGFDMKSAGELFTAFNYLPGCEEYRGFGVGLAKVDRIIRRHGGQVWAESEPDRGATFYFTLQLHERNERI